MDSDKIKGDVQKPYNKPQEDPKSSDKVDPEKFKKVMKVDESEESQKRKKRNLPREEEEGEDELAVEEPQTPSGSFSEFMSDKEELDSVFDKESGGVRRQAAPQEDAFIAPPEESISTEGVEVDESGSSYSSAQSQNVAPSQSNNPSSAPQTPSETSSSAPSQTPPTSESEQPPSGNLPPFQGEFESQTPYQQQQEPTSQVSSYTQDTDSSSSTQQPQIPTKKEQSHQEQMPKKKEEDSSLLASQPKKSELDALKKKPKTGPAAETKTVPQEKQPTDKIAPIQQDVIDKPSAFLHTIPSPSPKEKLPQVPTKGSLEGSIEAKEPDAKILPIDEAFSGEGSKEKPFEEGKNEETLPSSGKIKQSGPFQRFTPQEVRNQKIGKEATTAATYEGLTVPTSTESEQGEMGGQHKKKDDQTFIEATSETAGIPLPTLDIPVSSIAPATETPAYTKLSPEVHELFEKIGGVILVQQNKGVTTTTVNINMPNSVFDGTQVILDQYSTAPNSYNIQLVGSPESVKVFSQNLDALKASFKQANFNFEVNIQNPILTRGKKSPHLIRRKGSAGSKKEK
ncbi:MAG: hypothetical protein H7A38_06250 [Chlamydiales bacterium]|nr:hypothetical protein [Chlamydiales bacterium]